VSETDERTGQTFWLCPACWIEYLHGLDEAAGQDSLDERAAEPVPGGERVCPTCHHRQQVAS
jgi:hypothetical protein